ncbi:MAG: adenylate/guanylate cyclase domain-containing protein [Alphaproteobacteria bacterium]|nr:adenylate/guanylate cyclase domain-containing protein [Alphaproteobacteria bacterium]MBU1559291.1 adenylate/guanylate cyclase domain-containing protein [Alphaproteobacteria bacterium]MBU2304678.1 adenylate/guanylate cyclase domain-containing protein [Alphaproteobacteria bacterium]MBU2369935.1 adenylate/guanylate cyclase domain-containing protein [Alphaproteobacteria bacterium]
MWKRRLSALLFGAAVVVALVALRAADPYAVRVARETTFDVFQQLKPRPAPAELPVRIIDIDEASLAAIGQWPWSRQVMARIADRLTELGASAIAFDILFSEPDRLSPSAIVAGGEDYDALFARALAERPTILAVSRAGQGGAAPAPKSGFAMTGTDPLPGLPMLDGVAAPLPALAAAAAGLGVASLDREGAGVARRLPLLWSNGAAPLPTLSVEALRVALGVSTLVVLGDTAGAGTVEGLRIGQFEVPTGPNGDMWLYYRELPPETYVSAQRLLAADYAELAPALAGHIVLVGASATGLLDIRASPLGGAVPGVSIHLQALEQMLTGTFLHRADWVGGLELLVIAVSAVAVVLALLLTGPLLGLLVSGVIAGLVLAGSWLAFAQYGLLIDPGSTLFAVLVVYAAMAFFQFAVTDADKRRIRRAFAHYVEPSLLAQIEADEGLLKLGGDVRELTVMFSDVRNFTALSERTAPAELVGILNRLFAALGAAIVGHQGTIDKFMGDAVMAFWNAPVDVPQHARRACEAALAMREALQQLNAQQASVEPIAIGIGISTGPALVGNMGFEARFDYSCIGDTVNVASRLEGACRYVGYDVLVTAETRAAVPDLAFLDAGHVVLKGISHPEPIHLLVGPTSLAASPEFGALRTEHEALVAAWARGETAADALARCRAAALRIDPRLGGFYDASVQRRADFAPAVATGALGEARLALQERGAPL